MESFLVQHYEEIKKNHLTGRECSQDTVLFPILENVSVVTPAINYSHSG